MKNCNKCSTLKELILFPKRKSSKDGYRNTCKICVNVAMKIRYQRDDVKIKEQEKSQKWYQNNKEYQKEKTKEYKKISRQNIEIKLRDNLRNRLNGAIKNNTKIGSAVTDLGCTIEELKKHLESQFTEGMNWDNWSRSGWHIDHVKRLADFELTEEVQFKEACHYTNLQPLWAKDNWSKG